VEGGRGPWYNDVHRRHTSPGACFDGKAPPQAEEGQPRRPPRQQQGPQGEAASHPHL